VGTLLTLLTHDQNDKCPPPLSTPAGQGTVDLKPGKNGRIYSMGRKRYCQILEASLADAGTYRCDTVDISTTCSLEVYGEARRGFFKAKMIL